LARTDRLLSRPLGSAATADVDQAAECETGDYQQYPGAARLWMLLHGQGEYRVR